MMTLPTALQRLDTLFTLSRRHALNEAQAAELETLPAVIHAHQADLRLRHRARRGSCAAGAAR
ncbi:MAG TPA: hypothetical protein VF606_00515 [Geminicoccaceae bacterium]|jgi:hypothetical protein